MIIKKIVVLMFSLILLFPYLTVNSFALVYNGNVDAYVVIDAVSGDVLQEKNAHKVLYPASITKIMTGALTLEHGNLEDKHMISEAAVMMIPNSSTHINLVAGEIFSVETLLSVMMVHSANDVANGLAEYIAGDIKTFATLMTTTAKEVGALNTNFSNANGLHDENHYTTAYDMAMITRWALEIEEFREYFKLKKYTMPPTKMQSNPKTYWHRHNMISSSEYYQPYVNGGKNGWVFQSGHTLVTLAEQNGVEIICVVLKGEKIEDTYSATKVLLEKTFNQFKLISFTPSEISHSSVDLLKGNTIVGTVNFVSDDIAFLVPAAFSKTNIVLDYDILENGYDIDEDISPKVNFIGDQGIVISTAYLDYTIDNKVPKTISQSNEGIKKRTVIGYTVSFAIRAIIGVFILIHH